MKPKQGEHTIDLWPKITPKLGRAELSFCFNCSQEVNFYHLWAFRWHLWGPPKGWNTAHSLWNRVSLHPLEYMAHFQLTFRLSVPPLRPEIAPGPLSQFATESPVRSAFAVAARFSSRRVETFSTFLLHPERDDSEIASAVDFINRYHGNACFKKF